MKLIAVSFSTHDFKCFFLCFSILFVCVFVENYRTAMIPIFLVFCFFRGSLRDCLTTHIYNI